MSATGAALEALFWAKVEKTDDCWLWRAWIDDKGYGRFNVSRSPKMAHRVAYEWECGPIQTGLVIDHICHTKTCVNPRHLRAVTQKQNLEHHVAPYSNNTSGVRGVHWNKNAKKWQGLVSHHGKSAHAGYFADIKDAEAAVIALRNELFTHNDADRTA